MSKKKVIFVRPPNLQKSGLWKKQGVIRSPINIALLAAYLRSRGNYDCFLVDFEIIPVLGVEQMARTILKYDPDYVCFTSLTPRYPIIVKTARQVKLLRKEVVTIVGGPHVTGAPNYSLFDGLDYAVFGEGEEALLELLDRVESKKSVADVENLIYWNDREVIINKARPFLKDVNSLPLPAWDLMDINEYLDPIYFEGSHMGVFTSRGCPYDCIFCASNVTWKRKVRLRSVENVMQELRYIVNGLKVKNILFFDDNFDSDKKRALDLCNAVIREEINIKYIVQIRADSLSIELAQALKKSGCQYVAVGVESGNEDMLKYIGKKETKSHIKRGVQLLKDVGLPVIASYIIGLPGDTHKTIRETIDFAFELDTEQMKFMLLAPVPGTKVFDLAMQKKLVDPSNFEQLEGISFYDTVSVNLSKVSSQDLIRYQDEAYARFDSLRAERKGEVCANHKN